MSVKLKEIKSKLELQIKHQIVATRALNHVKFVSRARTSLRMS